jgi:hypothetical protein
VLLLAAVAPSCVTVAEDENVGAGESAGAEEDDELIGAGSVEDSDEPDDVGSVKDGTELGDVGS